jgi:putative glutamine amidotransferase
MRPRIAIPLPHSLDREYSARAIPQYEYAVEQAGGEPVRISLDKSSAGNEVQKLIQTCDAVLLPGSKADIDPARFNAPRSPHAAPADSQRENTDALVLQDAYNQRKPILGICYGLQSLNVHRGGSLIQHIPDFLPQELRNRVNHEAGRAVAVAHNAEIGKNSKLAEIIDGENRAGHGFSRATLAPKRTRALAPKGDQIIVPVNSSHHQSAGAIGERLRIVARCPDDDIIEALEGTDDDHFVLAVQWHPERSVDDDQASRSIFAAFIEAAKEREIT